MRSRASVELWQTVRSLPDFWRLIQLRMASQFGDGLFQATVAGALLFPATLSLVNTTFAEGHERNRALAVWGSAGAGGMSLGVLAGGVLTGVFGWRAVLFVNIPITAVLLALAPRKAMPA